MAFGVNVGKVCKQSHLFQGMVICTRLIDYILYLLPISFTQSHMQIIGDRVDANTSLGDLLTLDPIRPSHKILTKRRRREDAKERRKKNMQR